MDQRMLCRLTRSVPNMPGIIGVREGTDDPESIAFFEGGDREGNGYRILASTADPSWNLDECLELYLSGIRAAVRFDHPITVLPEDASTTCNYHIVLLAPGSLVAYNANFVCQFEPQFERWIVHWIAVDAWDYRLVTTPGGESLHGQLTRFGNIFVSITCEQQGELPIKQPGEKSCLFASDAPDTFGILQNMWILVGEKELFADMQRHTFAWRMCDEDTYWVLEHCCDEIDEEGVFEACPLRGRRLDIDSLSSVFVVRKEEYEE